jgi:uncharacterized protein
MADKELQQLLTKAEALLDRAAPLLPPGIVPTDWNCSAFQFHAEPVPGYFQGLPKPHHCEMDDLLGLERQKQLLIRNTAQFVAGYPANNALLWGARGTGKSSLIKALLTKFRSDNLRLIEVDKDHLVKLPQILSLIESRPERFVLYCDDLSFEANDASYKALKVVLDGSLQAPAENILIYASSNRRHLMPEFFHDNLHTKIQETEIHASENVDEKLSLTERFGLWLSFHAFNQQTYLDIVHHWVNRLSTTDCGHKDLESEALRWALNRGSRSGRVAKQFAQDWVGQHQLMSDSE